MNTTSPPGGEIVSNHVYHNKWTEISSTRFKPFYRSPAEFRWPIPQKPSDALELGIAAHAAILEPDKLQRLLVVPAAPFTTQAGKDAWRQWLSDRGTDNVDALKLKKEFMNAARTIAAQRDTDIVTEEQLSLATDMAASVLESSPAMTALSNGVFERSFRADGFKARPDCIQEDALIDLKTTSKFDRFEWQVRDLLYPESLAWYDTVLDACGTRIEVWVWIAIESTPYRLNDRGQKRHRIKTWIVESDARQQALARLDEARADYVRCCATNNWPTADDDVGFFGHIGASL